MLDLIIIAEMAAVMWDLMTGTRGASLLGVVIGICVGLLFAPS